LRDVSDPHPEHHDRQEHDLRDRIREEHHRAQQLIQASRDTRQEPEHDAGERPDDESRHGAGEAGTDVRQELAGPERLTEVPRDLQRPHDEVRMLESHRELPDRERRQEQREPRAIAISWNTPHYTSHSMPSSSASEFPRSTRVAAIRSPSAVRRRRCSTSAPHTRWRSRRYSTSTSVERMRTSCAPASASWTLPIWCTVRGAGVRAWARGCWN